MPWPKSAISLEREGYELQNMVHEWSMMTGIIYVRSDYMRSAILLL